MESPEIPSGPGKGGGSRRPTRKLLSPQTPSDVEAALAFRSRSVGGRRNRSPKAPASRQDNYQGSSIPRFGLASQPIRPVEPAASGTVPGYRLGTLAVA